jgi:hypothetical protein
VTAVRSSASVELPKHREHDEDDVGMATLLQDVFNSLVLRCWAFYFSAQSYQVYVPVNAWLNQGIRADTAAYTEQCETLASFVSPFKHQSNPGLCNLMCTLRK